MLIRGVKLEEFCEQWQPKKLLPLALRLAKILLGHEHVLGVAITGSLARLEPWCHDVDFMVLCDGTLPDGGSSIPPRHEGYETLFEDDIDFFQVLGPAFYNAVCNSRQGVPLNLIFTQAIALWNCEYLQALTSREKFNSFYKRVFTDVPLFLLLGSRAKGKLADFITSCTEEFLPLSLKQQLLLFEKQPRVRGIWATRIKHLCEEAGCRPTQTWEECEAEIKARKNHPWHS